MAIGTPPKLTPVILLQFVQFMFTFWPSIAISGLTDVITGGKKVKPPSVAAPPLVTTLMSPDAPVPITASILTLFCSTWYDTGALPPKVSELAYLRFVPVNIIVVPPAALSDEAEVNVGAAIVNPSFVAVPKGVTIFTKPATA